MACPLFADETDDRLAGARAALASGSDDALTLAARALKASPEGAGENLNISLAMFWAGHFDDSARYMRRAVAADRNLLMGQKLLAETMPGKEARSRLDELARDAQDDPELCFLTGTLLMINKDRARALAFLVRAEELAGTDAQAARLADEDAGDRNALRGTTALADGDWDDAARSFTFAALDSPKVAEHYAGLVIALAASGDDDGAVKLAEAVYARYQVETLLPWLVDLTVRRSDVVKAAARLAVEDAALEHYRLAGMLYLAAGWYRSARETGVKGLLLDKLDDFIHDMQSHMERNDLSADPDKPDLTDQPPENPGDAPDEPPPPAEQTLDDARRLIRRAEYTDALKILDGFVTDDAAPEVYHLVFVASVGRGELNNAQTALQAWFERVDDDERARANALRELFSSVRLFDEWRAKITTVRDADPNRGLPRLLNCYVEITRGRYANARDELIVARIESPSNPMVQGLDRILTREDFRNDRTPDGIVDDPTPKALVSRADTAFRTGDYEGARTFYLRAVEADPSLPFVALGLLRCEFALGNYDNAITQLKHLFDEQDMANKEAREFVLILEAGYSDEAIFETHLAALKAECEARPLSTSPWLLYGVILLTRTGTDITKARDALKTWHDNDRSKTRDPVAVKLYEYARKRAS